MTKSKLDLGKKKKERKKVRTDNNKDKPFLQKQIKKMLNVIS